MATNRSPVFRNEEKIGRLLLWGELAVVAVFVLYQFYGWAIACHIPMKSVPGPDRLDRSIALQRGSFGYFYFPSRRTETRAVIFFGSGDRGWGGWEDAVSRAMAFEGYDVVGIDSNLYALTDYDLGILEADYTLLAQQVEAPYGNHPPPLILGGWSTGAEMAVAAAGGPHPPPGVVGLLLLSPGDRSRYGLHASDRLDLTPTGPGTFALADFAPNLRNLRVLQWHAGLDVLDSVTWLQTLAAPHKEMVFPGVWHDFNGPSEIFVQEMARSIAWLLPASR
jgi:hypothetical protein